MTVYPSYRCVSFCLQCLWTSFVELLKRIIVLLSLGRLKAHPESGRPVRFNLPMRRTLHYSGLGSRLTFLIAGATAPDPWFTSGSGFPMQPTPRGTRAVTSHVLHQDFGEVQGLSKPYHDCRWVIVAWHTRAIPVVVSSAGTCIYIMASAGSDLPSLRSSLI